jgi:hypothetical protein
MRDLTRLFLALMIVLAPLFLLILRLSVWLAIIYVIIHFILKFW